LNKKLSNFPVKSGGKGSSNPFGEDVSNAAWRGHLDEIKRVIHQANQSNQSHTNNLRMNMILNQADQRTFTPLMYAAAEGHNDVVCYLIQQGAALTLRDKYGNTALHWGTIFGHVGVVATILSACPQDDIDLENLNGHSAFVIALAKHNCDLVELFLQFGADVNQQLFDSVLGERLSLLHLAVAYNDVKSVIQLIEGGFDLMLSDEQGDNALHWAIREGYFSVANFLVSKCQWLLTAPNQSGETPFDLYSQETTSVTSVASSSTQQSPRTHSVQQFQTPVQETPKITNNVSEFGRISPLLSFRNVPFSMSV